MGYRNTFDQLDWMWLGYKKEPINLEDYWVTKTFHSLNQKSISFWRKVIGTRDSNYNPWEMNLNLNCGHWQDVSIKTFREHPYMRNFRVSCISCGGTGEIKFDE